MRYSIIDPTGNITALVEDDIAVAEQPTVALDIMRRHSDVEQVGFVRMLPRCHEVEHDGQPAVALRMAGGEFCGNASMSAAALYLLRCSRQDSRQLTQGAPHQPAQDYARQSTQDSPVPVDSWKTVWLRVSGATRLVETRLRRNGRDAFAAQINMPAALHIKARELTYQQLCDTVPIVVMEGISHIIVDEESAFSGLCKHPFDAELAVCRWCEELQTDGLGIMFVERENSHLRMTPLVYVPGSGTVFWENSCASGSAAVGMYYARKQNASLALTLHEPGGDLCVVSNPLEGTTWLRGSVRHMESYDM